MAGHSARRFGLGATLIVSLTGELLSRLVLLLAGWIGEVAGARVALLETAIVTLLSVAVLVRSPVPRLRDASRYLAERAPEASQVLS